MKIILLEASNVNGTALHLLSMKVAYEVDEFSGSCIPLYN
jgi:hypothetical protein